MASITTGVMKAVRPTRIVGNRAVVQACSALLSKLDTEERLRFAHAGRTVLRALDIMDNGPWPFIRATPIDSTRAREPDDRSGAGDQIRPELGLGALRA